MEERRGRRKRRTEEKRKVFEENDEKGGEGGERKMKEEEGRHSKEEDGEGKGRRRRKKRRRMEGGGDTGLKFKITLKIQISFHAKENRQKTVTISQETMNLCLSLFYLPKWDVNLSVTDRKVKKLHKKILEE